MMLEVLEARNKGEADLKPEGLGCKSHIWKKKKTTNNKTPGTLNFLNHRNMKDMSGVSLNQNYLTVLFPTRICPLWIKPNLWKEKGEPAQEMTACSNRSAVRAAASAVGKQK